MVVHSIKDNKNLKIIGLLKENFSKIDDVLIEKNYHPSYSNFSSNFFYILNDGRYLNGNYYVMEKDGVFYGSAGWNPYEDKALLLTRAYIPKEYRGQFLFAKYLLPIMFLETTEYKKLWITCNDYNISIYHAISRLNQNKPAGLFNQWPKIYKNFRPIGLKTVNNTLQYVVEFEKD